jgi:GNAT superfamily N-acetyltransferase
MRSPTTAQHGAVTARGFNSSDEPHVLELLQTVFGEWPRDIRDVTPVEFFRWKQMESPFGPSRMMVVELDGRVAGFGAYMPWRFLARGQIVNAMRGVDFAVSPDYRRRGVSMALRLSSFPSDISLVWSNPNEQISPGSRKAGRKLIRISAHFVRPRRPVAIIGRTCARGSRTPQELTVEAEPALDVIEAETCRSLLERGGQVSDRLATAKSLDYLRWRYRHPTYHAVRLESGGVTRGVAIFRCRRHGSLWVSHICELFAEDDDRRTVSLLLGRAADAAPSDLIRCSFSSRAQAASLGFIRRRRGSVLTVHPLEPGLVPDPTLPDSWSLSVGDLELL